MVDKSRNTLLIIGGGYLVYTGSKLIFEVNKNHPSNETLFIAFGAVFVVLGLCVVVQNLRRIYKAVKDEKRSDIIVEEIEVPEDIAEPLERRTNRVQMVKVGAETPDLAEDLEEVEKTEPLNDSEDVEETLDEEYEEVYVDLDAVPEEDDEEEDLFEEKLERI